MVISLDNKPRKVVRQWYENQIYLVHRFRTLYNGKQRATNPREKKMTERKMGHLQKKVNQHMDYGEFLGIGKEQIRNFNLVVIEEIKKGGNVKAIIQKLTNSQK
ncbi:hypothetical protein AMJ48_02815 [Parcubacteria bacterium DG_74_1]|nr:MAG: hypothetical protein AMJ48_02815 [Parcubacteria bacterium DG_74_1]